MSATSGTIGTNVSFGAFGFDPGRKAPKAALVPSAGGKSVALRVFAYSADRIDAQVVKGKAGEYQVELRSADRSVAPVTADGTFTILLPEPASVEPATGPVNVPIEIRGASFGSKKGSVKIGGRPAKVTSWANDLIRVVVPKRKLSDGPQPVVVTNVTGTSTAAVSYTVTSGSSSGGEYLRFDAPVVGHFEVTQREPLFFGASHNVSQDFVSIGGMKKPNGTPAFTVTITAPELATPAPYELTTMPAALGAPYVGAVFNDGAGNVYQATVVNDFRVTITGYADGVLSGTFTGTMGKLVGSGTPTTTITNGAFNVRLDIVGQ
jgi:hypothetical protein